MNARYFARFGCDETRLFANAYTDRELLVETSMEIEHHLNHCRHCTSLVREVHHLKKRMRQSMRTIRAPADLAGRIRRSLGSIHNPGD